MLKALLLAVTVIAHESGYYTSLANHLSRWLKGEKIAATVVTPATMKTALEHEKLAFLVGFNDPAANELAELRDYRARGGKLVVFHSASPVLAKMMGVKPLGYRTQSRPGEWSMFKFSAGPEGCPDAITQTSTVLQRAVPLADRGRIIAEWYDRRGQPTGDAAWIMTDAGFWMTHVLLADGDEDLKAQLVAAICRSVDPMLWDPKAAATQRAAIHERTRQLALAQVSRKGEIHAVWDHSGCGLYPGEWPRTMQLLRQSHITDVFVNVAGSGFAHYPSDVLPRSKTFADEGDQLAACLAAAKNCGIRVHAWMLCFTATRATPERLADFERRGWRLKNSQGKLTEYLDPANGEVRARILAAIDELQAKYPALSGIHLDFVRWYEGAVKPKNAATVISEFVASARQRVKAPRWLTAAVLGKYPTCIASVGQDWDSWISSNLVDYVVPMDYTEDLGRFEGYLMQHGMMKKHAERTIVGIGVTANESRLDATQVIEQIRLSRKYAMAGNALFDLDAVLVRKILPYLRLKMWK